MVRYHEKLKLVAPHNGKDVPNTEKNGEQPKTVTKEMLAVADDAKVVSMLIDSILRKNQ